jgi:hypothetical protein
VYLYFNVDTTSLFLLRTEGLKNLEHYKYSTFNTEVYHLWNVLKNLKLCLYHAYCDLFKLVYLTQTTEPSIFNDFFVLLYFLSNGMVVSINQGPHTLAADTNQNRMSKSNLQVTGSFHMNIYGLFSIKHPDSFTSSTEN